MVYSKAKNIKAKLTNMHCIRNSSPGNCTPNCRVYIDRKATFVCTFYIFADAVFSFNILAKYRLSDS